MVDSKRHSSAVARGDEEHAPGLSAVSTDTAPTLATPATVSRFADLSWTAELLYLLTWRDLKVRYQGTALGFFLSVAMLLGMVLYFALSKVVRFDVPDYQLFLLAGLFPWYWFQSSVISAIGSFTGNGNLIKKVRFPRYVLPLSIIANNTVHFVLSLPVLILFSLIFASGPDWTWLIGIPLISLIQLVLITGASLAAGTINVFFRDLEHLAEVFLTLLFYLTPVIYPLDLVPEEYETLLMLNPMTSLIEGWHDVIVNNDLPGFEIWPSVVLSVVVLGIGSALYARLQRHFADVL
jgi:homopolymeric O-antigen transport system permease protein